MLPLANALMRTGLALKVHQVKRATESYVRDRGLQGQGIAVSYAVAAGLYAAAGIFLLAALLVGVTALFRWVELRYGLFEAFGASAVTLLVLATLFAVLASSRLKRPTKRFPSLSSRLRVAIKANPVVPLNSEQPRPPAATARTPTGSAVRSSSTEFKPARPPQRSEANQREAKIGLFMAATLAGWALARRRKLSHNITRSRNIRKAHA
jgi:hypothetical protein